MAKQGRGFAAMDPKKHRQIASRGGKAAHEKGKAYEWDSESAAAAGRKGGIASRGGRRAVLEPKGEGDGNTQA